MFCSVQLSRKARIRDLPCGNSCGFPPGNGELSFSFCIQTQLWLLSPTEDWPWRCLSMTPKAGNSC